MIITVDQIIISFGASVLIELPRATIKHITKKRTHQRPRRTGYSILVQIDSRAQLDWLNI
jgi:hypothetical protein